MTTRKLNLGSGEFPLEGYLNVDYASVSGPDLRHDLNHMPYPFEDGSFDEVLCSHALEHLDDPFAAMREIHRICAPGATVIIRVPHFSRAMSHPEHRRGFDVTLPYYFDPNFPGGYQGVHLSLRSQRLTWFAQPALKRRVLSPLSFGLASALGHVIDVAANLSPALCSKLWCFWVGGFDEVSFVFEVAK